jgi:hypothetical protein
LDDQRSALHAATGTPPKLRRNKTIKLLTKVGMNEELLFLEALPSLKMLN